jgi:hypothetical protein
VNPRAIRFARRTQVGSSFLIQLWFATRHFIPYFGPVTLFTDVNQVSPHTFLLDTLTNSSHIIRLPTNHQPSSSSMAEPASKRVKTSHNKNDKRRIVAFSSPGLKPDACFKVFDSLEFHVHSDILKLHSGFFRQVLVAMNIADYPRVNSAFTYQWVAVFDEDRARWSVTPDRGDVPV